MAETNSKMTVKNIEGVTVILLSDQRILDEVNISRIGGELEEIARRQPNPQMVIDFANVSNMSSSALGMLITLHKRIREAEGQLRLCNIQPSIQEVFKITRLDEIFQICDSQAEALESIQ